MRIEQLTKEGHGLAFIEQQNGMKVPVEVPFTIPGDEAKVLLLRKRKGCYSSLLQELVKASPLRVMPRCTHFGTCGGCRWQELPYQEQLNQKEDYVRHCFVRHLTSEVAFYPILPCEPPWGYRNKMELSFSNNKAKDRFLGLNLYAGRGKVFNMKECHLPSPWIAEAVQVVDRWWEESGLDAYHPPSNTGSLRTLTLREGLHTGDRMVVLTVSGNPDFALHRRHLDRFVALVREAVEPVDSNQYLSVFLRIQQIAKGMTTNFYEMHLYGASSIREILSIELAPGEPLRQLMFHISPSAFFQPNTRQAERLYSRALQLAKIPNDGVVYDLYCGTGTLGICTSGKVKQVIGIELSPESALDARENAKNNGIDNFTVYTGDVGKLLERLSKEQSLPHPDLIMVDPPRVGLDAKAIELLLSLRPAKILYISCNPLTQSDNIDALIRGGYRLTTLQPVDQFPHTVHIENIAVLERC